MKPYFVICNWWQTRLLYFSKKNTKQIRLYNWNNARMKMSYPVSLFRKKKEIKYLFQNRLVLPIVKITYHNLISNNIITDSNKKQ